MTDLEATNDSDDSDKKHITDVYDDCDYCFSILIQNLFPDSAINCLLIQFVQTPVVTSLLVIQTVSFEENRLEDG